MNNELTASKKSTFVIIGGTSGIGKALAMQLRNENNTVHIASRHTGLDISSEKSICEYFESIGVFDHLVRSRFVSISNRLVCLTIWLLQLAHTLQQEK